MLSRALLIARVAFFFFQRFSSEPRGQPGSIVGLVSHLDAFWKVCFVGPSRTLPAVYVSAVIDGGSHPFPFRTRKLSLLSPMVLGLRARESRSLQDSRPLDGKPSRGLFFYIPLALHPGKDAPASARSRLDGPSVRAASAHAPCLTEAGPFLYPKIAKSPSYLVMPGLTGHLLCRFPLFCP